MRDSLWNKTTIRMSLKLGLYRNEHKLCYSEFCKDLPSHSHSENIMKNQLLDHLLKPQLSQALLERERDFKWVYSATFERCHEQIARSHANRNRFKLGHHLGKGQKVLYENHRQDLSISQKLQQRRLGPFTVTKRITNTTYQIRDDKDPAILKTVHRNYSIKYYPKEESLLPMIEEYVPSAKCHDDFYERFLEKRVQRLNKTTENTSADSIPFPIVPLSSTPNVLPTKRISNTSEDSGVNSTPTSSPTIASHPINYPPGTPSLNPSTSQTITPPTPPSQPLTPIQRSTLSNTRKYQNKELK